MIIKKNAHGITCPRCLCWDKILPPTWFRQHCSPWGDTHHRRSLCNSQANTKNSCYKHVLSTGLGNSQSQSLQSILLPSSGYSQQWTLDLRTGNIENTNQCKRHIRGDTIKGALSRHVCCVPTKAIQKSFFLTFTRAKNIAMEFRTKSSTKKSTLWYKMVSARTLSKLRLNISKCNPSLSLPSRTTESS